MKKKLLLFTLLFSKLIEVALSFLCFFTPVVALELFGIQYNDQTAFLGHIIAWSCSLVSLIIIFIVCQLKINVVENTVLIYLLGFRWIGLGISIYVFFKKPDNLILDSLKGCILIVLNYLYRKKINAN